MNRSQIWGIVRHVATAAAGYLATSPDPRLQAVSVALGALGLGGSVYTKRERGKPLQLPKTGVHMLVLGVAALVAGAGLSGCASSGSAIVRPVDQELRTFARAAAITILSRDSGSEADLVRVTEAIDTAIAVGEPLTNQRLKAFLDTLGVDRKRRMIVAAFVLEANDRFSQGRAVLDLKDSEVVALLKQFQAGIRDGIEFYRIFGPGAS